MKHFSKKTDPKINWEKVDSKALQMLDNAREIAGVPFRITSNHRTIEQDLKLAGFAGAHTDEPCTAFDIAFTNGKQCHAILRGLFQAGFPRIGVNFKNNHIHVDCSPTRPSPTFFIE